MEAPLYGSLQEEIIMGKYDIPEEAKLAPPEISNDVATTRFTFHFTYDCNLSCKMCDRFIDVVKWDDTNMVVEDIIEGARMCLRSHVNAVWVKVAGGEPLVHPQFYSLCEAIKEHWIHTRRTKFTVASNAVIALKKNHNLRVRMSAPKEKYHQPVMISPKDLGINPVLGYVRMCKTILRCGRMFDTFGFTSCAYAGVIGRMINYDPYSERPIMFGDIRICEHCPMSVSFKTREKLRKKVAKGELEYPTKTYREGTERLRDDPITFTKFQERLRLHENR